MNFERLENGQILQVQNIGNTVIKTGYCSALRVKITPAKETATIGEDINISLAWEQFNTQSGQYETDLNSNFDFLISINGQQTSVLAADAGFIYRPDEPGVFKISGLNPGCDSTSCNITVAE